VAVGARTASAPAESRLEVGTTPHASDAESLLVSAFLCGSPDYTRVLRSYMEYDDFLFVTIYFTVVIFYLYGLFRGVMRKVK
jgi:hypothetical protein